MNSLIGKIKNTQGLTGKVNNKEVPIYPELENLEVTPTAEEQKFKSNMYGYNEVTVKAIETEVLNVTPNTSEQNFDGLYSKVTVAGDSNLIPENIKSGVSIFGVEGNVNTVDFKMTNATYLFYNGARLEHLEELLSLYEKATNSSYMFYICRNLTELDISNFDTSNVTDMQYMFASCENLTELDISNFDTSNVTNMQYMFGSCKKLTEIDLSNFDMSKVVYISSMFYNCNNLKTINSFKNLGKGYTRKSNNSSYYKLDLSPSIQLTYESLMDIINNLYDLNLSYDVANGGTLYTQGLVLGSTNLAKLTAEEIAIATSRGWSVS